MQAPSKKWTQVVALTALATMWVSTAAWDQEETIAAIGIVSQAALGYFVSNDTGNPASSQAGHVDIGLIIGVLLVVILVIVLLRLV
jgi:hypothetical protein